MEMQMEQIGWFDVGLFVECQSEGQQNAESECEGSSGISRLEVVKVTKGSRTGRITG